jgi:hypothetical protein
VPSPRWKFGEFFESVFYFLIAFLVGVQMRGISGLPRDLLGGWTVFVMVSLILGLKKLVNFVEGDKPLVGGVDDDDD